MPPSPQQDSGYGPIARPLLPCGRSCPRCAPVQLGRPDPAPLPRCFPPGSRRIRPRAGAQPWPWLLAGTSGGVPACPPPAAAGARDKGAPGAPGDFEHTRQFGKPSFPPRAAVGFGDFNFSLFKGKAFFISAPPDQTSCGLAQAGVGAQAALGGLEIFCRFPGPAVGWGHSCVSQNELGRLRGAGSEARAPWGRGSGTQHHSAPRPPAPCATQGTGTRNIWDGEYLGRGVFGTGNIWGAARGAEGSRRAPSPAARGGCRAQHPVSILPAPVPPSPPLSCRVSLCKFTD